MTLSQAIRDAGWPLWVLLAATFAVKVLVVWQLKDHPLLHPDAGLDTTAYVNLARRVAAGDLTLGPALYFVSPLYIYFLAAGLWLFDSFTAVRLAQVLLGTASVACIFFTARTWFSARAAWIAATLAALTGLFTFYESLILQASLDAFLTSLALLALSRTKNGDGSHFLAGVVFAVATLNRPNMLFGAAAVIAMCLIVRHWRRAALIGAGMLIGFLPALARNVVVSGEWSLISSHGGLNLYIGNNENASGFYREVPGVRPLIEGQQEDTRRVASQALGREVSDAEASSYFRGRATSWMTSHPIDAATLFARKIYYTFHAQHVALPHSYPFFAYEMDTALQFLVVGPWLLVPIGIVGLIHSALNREKPTGKSFLVWLAFVPGYAIGVALFFVAERYRMPLFVPLCVGAGAFVDNVLRRRALVAPLAAAAVIGVAVNWPLPLDDSRWLEGLRTAQRLIITGHYDEADAWVERLERNAPRAGRAHHGAGMQLLVQDQQARALRHMRRAIELNFASPADDVEMWLRLGRFSTRSESAAAAEPFFRRASELKPDQASARQQYGLNLILLGRNDDARRELQAAVRLDANDADSLAHLAYCEVKLGDADGARQHVRAALARQPDHALARQLAAALGIG